MPKLMIGERLVAKAAPNIPIPSGTEKYNPRDHIRKTADHHRRHGKSGIVVVADESKHQVIQDENGAKVKIVAMYACVKGNVSASAPKAEDSVRDPNRPNKINTSPIMLPNLSDPENTPSASSFLFWEFNML